MVEPDAGSHQVDYAINPDGMTQAIDWYLSPVIKDLGERSGTYANAHDAAATAHDSEAAGWFGGAGNGEVKLASSSFLNAAEWQLRQLVQDQAELVSSLQEYRTMLQGHINWARETDQKAADRFRAIDSHMDGLGR
jgi:hypothetical protein